jgi:hypothetical protein
VPQIPYWGDAPAAWDQVILGSITLPGVAKVTVKRSRKIDVKSGAGVSGATTTVQGFQPADVTILVRLSSDADLQAMFAALGTLEPVIGPTATDVAFSILHPATTMRRVSAVVVKDIDGPTQTGPGI